MHIRRFENELVHHCAPALCRLKPANLVSFAKREFPELPHVLQTYQPVMESYGIHMELLCSCDKRWLVLVYDPALLQRQLSQSTVSNLLQRDGYPAGGMRAQLEFLKYRLQRYRTFPHEIGLFLGYPISDVLAFQQNRGEGCKLWGYWKVYTNVEAAKKSFATFDACRDALEQALRAGKTVTQLLEMQTMRTA